MASVGEHRHRARARAVRGTTIQLDLSRSPSRISTGTGTVHDDLPDPDHSAAALRPVGRSCSTASYQWSGAAVPSTSTAGREGYEHRARSSTSSVSQRRRQAGPGARDQRRRAAPARRPHRARPASARPIVGEVPADPRGPLVGQIERGRPFDVATLTKCARCSPTAPRAARHGARGSLLADPARARSGAGRGWPRRRHERRFGALAWAHLAKTTGRLARLLFRRMPRSGLSTLSAGPLHAVGAADDDPPGVLAELVRDPRGRLRIREDERSPAASSALQAQPRRPGRPAWSENRRVLDWITRSLPGRGRHRLADHCAEQALDGDHGLRASGCDPRLGQLGDHIQSIAALFAPRPAPRACASTAKRHASWSATPDAPRQTPAGVRRATTSKETSR